MTMKSPMKNISSVSSTCSIALSMSRCSRREHERSHAEHGDEPGHPNEHAVEREQHDHADQNGTAAFHVRGSLISSRRSISPSAGLAASC